MSTKLITKNKKQNVVPKPNSNQLTLQLFRANLCTCTDGGSSQICVSILSCKNKKKTTCSQLKNIKLIFYLFSSLSILQASDRLKSPFVSYFVFLCFFSRFRYKKRFFSNHDQFLCFFENSQFSLLKSVCVWRKCREREREEGAHVDWSTNEQREWKEETIGLARVAPGGQGVESVFRGNDCHL